MAPAALLSGPFVSTAIYLVPARATVIITTAPATSVIVVTVSPRELPIIIVARGGNDSRAENRERAVGVPAHTLDNDAAVGVANAPHEDAIALPVERILEESIVLAIANRAGTTPFTDSP
jgi:hypothetical protein